MVQWSRFSFLRIQQTTLQSGCTILHSHQQLRVPIVSHPGHHSVLSLFWIFTILQVCRKPQWLKRSRIHLQCRRCRRLEFDLWLRKIPWRRKRQLTPVFLPGESHGQSSLVGYSHEVAKSQTRLSNSTIAATILPANGQGKYKYKNRYECFNENKASPKLNSFQK